MKLLGRAWATLDEAVCRAHSWLQSVRWISGCATGRLYTGHGTDNGANEAGSARCRNYVRTEGLGRGEERWTQGSLLRAKLGVFVSALILQGKQSRNHPLCPRCRYALLCLWWTWFIFIPRPAELVRPGLANTNGLTLQQHKSIQNANLRYETYIRITSSNKCASTQAGENYFSRSAGRTGFRTGLWPLV